MHRVLAPARAYRQSLQLAVPEPVAMESAPGELLLAAGAPLS
jgi:hypothetical protein